MKLPFVISPVVFIYLKWRPGKRPPVSSPCCAA
jgi:hypothetical protein